MSALELYFALGACSLVPHVGLEAAGAPFEPKLVKLHKGEQRTPAYLAMNPNGQAPVRVRVYPSPTRMRSAQCSRRQ